MHFVYGYYNGNATAAVREYRRRFPNRRQPSRNAFIRVHLSLRENGTVYSRNLRYYQKSQDHNRTNQILTYFDRNETSSTRRASLLLEIPKETIRRTLRRAHRHPYHFQPVQNLLPQDLRARRNFCEWLLHAVHDDARILTKILWTDEATFTRTGIANYHNSHTWSDNNPHAIRPAHFQHEFKVNVWAGILNGILVGPFLFQETVTTASFLDFLENNF
ncbi:hypothetical protein X777_07636 [Ooceraea biroi]|uniref:DUF4817 domain-containing protein n=1 Tax=Ooceraea biroi TaxID=2015173 RepID=A0A026WD37_OOCBI|nr:hypothetical protein X777_07636 [Ooceraea biroi]